MSSSLEQCFFCKETLAVGIDPIKIKPNLAPGAEGEVSCSPCWIEVMEGTVIELQGELENVLEPDRDRLPNERTALTHKFSIGGHEGYITVGEFPDGRLGEVFVKMAKQGTVMSGMMDVISTMVSIMLQYRIPLEVLVRKFGFVQFEPNGITPNPNIKFARSVVDYLVRYLGYKYLHPAEVDKALDEADDAPSEWEPGPPCQACGHMTIKNNGGFICENCGKET